MPLTAARSLAHRLPNAVLPTTSPLNSCKPVVQQARAAHWPEGCRAGRGKSLTPGLHVPHGSPPVLYRISRIARLLEPPPITAADVCRSSGASPSHRLGDQGGSGSASTKSKPAKATPAFRRHGRRRRPESRRDLPGTSGKPSTAADGDAVTAVFQRPPKLHRFVNNVPAWIVAMLCKTAVSDDCLALRRVMRQRSPTGAGV